MGKIRRVGGVVAAGRITILPWARPWLTISSRCLVMAESTPHRQLKAVGVFEPLVRPEPAFEVGHPLLQERGREPRAGQLLPERLGRHDLHEPRHPGQEHAWARP